MSLLSTKTHGLGCKLYVVCHFFFVASGSSFQQNKTSFFRKRKGWFPLGVDCAERMKQNIFHATPVIYADWKPAIAVGKCG